MAEQADILGTLKSGLGVAGKLAGKSFNGVSGLIKSEESSAKGLSGVYWTRGPWSYDSGLVPLLDFNESQDLGRFKVSIVKRVTTSKAERAFIQACGSCLDGDCLEDAKNGLLEAVESDPQYTDGYFMLGCIALELQHYEEAVAHFHKAMLCQQGLGAKLKKHLPSFRMVVRLTPSSVLALYPDLVGLNVLLAVALRQTGQVQAALSGLQQLLEVMPGAPILLFFMAIFRLECSQYTQLVEELCDVLPASTLQVANLLLVGCACVKLGDVATASEVYRKALESSDYDSLLRLDLQCALAECAGGAGKGDTERIKREYPGYQPFLQRLGIAVGVRSVAPQSQAFPASAPASQPAVSAPNVGVSPKTQAVAEPLPYVGATEPVANMPAMAAVPAVEPLPPRQEGVTKLVCAERQLEFVLGQQPFAVGRDEGDAVLSFDQSVSHHHARIICVNGRYQVEDLHSTNGTWLNGYRLNGGYRYEINRGDTVQFGLTRFRLL